MTDGVRCPIVSAHVLRTPEDVRRRPKTEDTWGQDYRSARESMDGRIETTVPRHQLPFRDGTTVFRGPRQLLHVHFVNENFRKYTDSIIFVRKPLMVLYYVWTDVKNIEEKGGFTSYVL